MGIVRKQSTYSTVFTYIGFAIGALNTLVLFPRFFDQSDYGLTRLIIGFALFFSAMSTLGSLNGLYKFFPFYDAYLRRKESDLPFLVVSAHVLGSLLFIAGALVFQGFLSRKFGNNSPLFVTHYRLVIPFTILFTGVSMMEAFCWVIKRTIISNLVKELFYRVIVTLLIVLYILKFISIETFFELFAFSYLPPFLVLTYVVFKDGNIRICTKISKVTRRLYAKILIFVSYHFSSLLITILPPAVADILIAGLSQNGLANVAIFSIPTYMVMVMDVPQRSMVGITVALISEAWKQNDRGKILELYQKTSLNLLIIGLGLFGLIYPNMDNIVRFLGPNYALAKNVFLVLGSAKLVDLGLGMNAQILTLSKYWRVDFFTSVGFIFINILLDYMMIKEWGVLGAAFGGAIALVFYNAVRLFYLWYLYRVQPFTGKTLLTLLLGICAMAIAYFIPFLGNIFIDGVVRCILFASLFAFSVLHFQVSEDMTALYAGLKNKFLGKGR